MIMKKELDYFTIENCLGGNQDWMLDPWMHVGGCAALTALDSIIYLQLRLGIKELTPLPLPSEADLNRKWYCQCGMKLKPYLRPRLSGVNKLSIYTDGVKQYLHDHNRSDIRLYGLDNSNKYQTAVLTVMKQVDFGLPVPYLLLNHGAAEYKDYHWHWFLLIGYRFEDDEFQVKAVTYGETHWLNFRGLWNTGYTDGSGIIVYEIESES